MRGRRSSPQARRLALAQGGAFAQHSAGACQPAGTGPQLSPGAVRSFQVSKFPLCYSFQVHWPESVSMRHSISLLSPTPSESSG